ncbi:MAG TPA: hypothetical protein VK524_30620 [Polyangiaceae bacterium]|nr:hypothetical protein [Polyangiaceae bacterium]
MNTRRYAILLSLFALPGCGDAGETRAAPSAESLTASESPTITVSQSTDLVDGQIVTVNGSGFTPESYGFVWQLCRDFFPCVPHYGFSPTDESVTYHVGTDGTFQLTLPAKLTLYSLPDGAARSCAEPGACLIRVSNQSGAGTQHDFPLSFRAASVPPAQKGTATIVSSTPLTSGALLRVQGAGWLPSRMLSVRTCSGAGYTQCNYSRALNADASGAFAFTEAQAPTFLPNDPSGSSEYVDCAAAPNLCALQIADPFDFAGTAVALPLTFPPPGTPTTLSATLVPNQNLRDGEVITLQVSGFPPDWSVTYCQRGSDQPQCGGPFVPGGATDANGVFQGPLLVRRAWGNPGSQWGTCVPHDPTNPFGPCTFVEGGPYTCNTPGSCVVDVDVSFGGVSQSFDLPLDFIPQAPQAGTLQLASSSVTAGTPIQVTGSGWGTVGSVRVSLCRKNSTSDETCRSPAVVQVAQDGSFSTSLTAATFVKYNTIPFGQNPPFHIWNDCTAAPGACVVHVQDSANSDVSAEVPLTITPAAGAGSVEMELRSPLISGLHVRTVGAGWPAARNLRILTCNAGTCQEMGPVTTDASGAFRGYALVLAPLNRSAECESAPGACTLTALDLSTTPTSAGVHVPLTFAQGDHFDVTTHYEPKWQDLLASGVSASGLPASELQRTGAAVTVWLFAVSGTTTGPRLPIAGSISHTTSYTADEYRQWSATAANYDYTVDELQKVGALFWAWLLAGQPPLPN